ncbi:hypothetical protein [Aquabacterium sp. OR-4]|uniref:hypothetical protein n=1 Tax=Aquabacterium sp. OR-4 TaxID=2978127 RepID=UPI0021B2C4B9|nr:hypothetical protein [Aquabacterium sp. OR-4]MDT7835038.1 hypothetical protein [Aquabacterium sp. OR-4]
MPHTEPPRRLDGAERWFYGGEPPPDLLADLMADLLTDQQVDRQVDRLAEQPAETPAERPHPGDPPAPPAAPPPAAPLPERVREPDSQRAPPVREPGPARQQ